MTAKQIHIKKWQNRLFLNGIRRALDDYGMIESGERVLVALSGGKDSMLLGYAMAVLARYSHRPFAPVFVHIDYGFGADYTELENVLEEWGYSLYREVTDIGEAVDFGGAKTPCYQCAKYRRGALVRVAKKMACQKIAFGHHLDDAVETFLMNLLKGGRLDSFDPVSKDAKSGLITIRPMVYVREESIIRAVELLDIPVMKSGCPHEESTARRAMKTTLSELKVHYPDIREKILSGLQNMGLKNSWAIDGEEDY